MVTQVHIALDEQTVENGGLHFVPGSHRCIMDIYGLYACYNDNNNNGVKIFPLFLFTDGLEMVCHCQSQMIILLIWNRLRYIHSGFHISTQHAYGHMQTHIHTHTYIHTHTHTYIHTYTHIYTHTYIHTYTHTYTRTYTHTYTHTNT